MSDSNKENIHTIQASSEFLTEEQLNDIATSNIKHNKIIRLMKLIVAIVILVCVIVFIGMHGAGFIDYSSNISKLEINNDFYKIVLYLVPYIPISTLSYFSLKYLFGHNSHDL